MPREATRSEFATIISADGLGAAAVAAETRAIRTRLARRAPIGNDCAPGVSGALAFTGETTLPAICPLA